IREARFDLVYANEAHALTAAWLARSHRRVPLVVARRVTFPLSHSSISLGRYRAAARILAISQAVGSELLAAGLDPQRIEVVPDVDSVYAAGDLFVFPSLKEGAGSSLLRAMAFGLPVLALARGGVPEIVEDGRNGVLVQEADAESLAQAAARMLRDQEWRSRLSRAAREMVVSQYSA